MAKGRSWVCGIWVIVVIVQEIGSTWTLWTCDIADSHNTLEGRVTYIVLEIVLYVKSC